MSGKIVKVTITDDYGCEVERIYENVTEETIENVEWKVLTFLTVQMFVEEKKEKKSIWEQEIEVRVK